MNEQEELLMDTQANLSALVGRCLPFESFANNAMSMDFI